MSTPTPVTVENLIDETSLINTFNDGVETQLVSPRQLGTQRITVQVTDDPLAPTLTSGTADADVLNKLSASGADFSAVAVGDTAINTVSGASALVTVVDSGVLLTLASDIFPAGTSTFRIVAAADLGYYTQRNGGGEWKRSGSKTGNNKGAAYVLPVNTASVVVDSVVYPIALADIATYPPITSAETA